MEYVNRGGKSKLFLPVLIMFNKMVYRLAAAVGQKIPSFTTIMNAKPNLTLVLPQIWHTFKILFTVSCRFDQVQRAGISTRN